MKRKIDNDPAIIEKMQKNTEENFKKVYSFFNDLTSDQKKILLLNLIQQNQDYILHGSARYGVFSIVEELMEIGINPNLLDSKNQTALHHAVLAKDIKMTELLLAHGADVNIPTKTGITPLHFAARNKDIDMTALLLKNEAKINAPTNKGVTPLHIALGLSYTNDYNGSSDLEFVDSDNRHIIKESNLDLVKLLITHKADLQAKTSVTHLSPIHLAAANGNIEILELLLNNGAKIPTNNYTIYNAAIEGGLDTLKFLLMNGLDINSKRLSENSPLHMAAAKGKSDIIQFLIEEKKVDVNIQNTYGNTALAQNLQPEVVALLLKYGADVNITNNTGATALHHQTHPKSLELILKTGINPNLILEHINPSNPKMLRDTELIKIIFEYGGDVKNFTSEKFLSLPTSLRVGKDNQVYMKLAKAVIQNNPLDAILSSVEIKDNQDLIFFALRAQLVNENDAKYINYSIKNLLLIKPDVNIIDLILQANKGNVLNSFEVIAKSEAIKYINEDSLNNLKIYIIKEASSMENDKVSEYLNSLKNKADFFKDGSIKDYILEVINSVTEDYKLPSLKILSLKSILGSIENNSVVDETNELEEPFPNMHGVYQEMIRDVILESNCIFSPQETKVKDHLLATMHEGQLQTLGSTNMDVEN
jgi:ankyrin repeat protein